MCRPWLCFDEFDKVPSLDAKRGIFLFLDGRREFEVEGRIIVNHAIAMTTLNTKPKDGLERLGIPDAYIRRSIVVDTDFVKSELGEVDLAAKEIFALKDFPKVSLKRLMLSARAPPLNFTHTHRFSHCRENRHSISTTLFL